MVFLFRGKFLYFRPSLARFFLIAQFCRLFILVPGYCPGGIGYRDGFSAATDVGIADNGSGSGV